MSWRTWDGADRYPTWCRILQHRWYKDHHFPEGWYRDHWCRRCENIDAPLDQRPTRASRRRSR